MSARLRSLLDILCDGKCHSLEELQTRAHLSQSQTRAAVTFLTEYGFAEMTDHNGKVRLTESAKELML